MRIYVGNLPYTCTADEVRELFSSYGNVDSVNLVTDRETGRPRGFGFVEMANGGESAIGAARRRIRRSHAHGEPGTPARSRASARAQLLLVARALPTHSPTHDWQRGQ